MTLASRAGIVALLIGFYAPISAKADNVDDYVSARMRQLHIPGLSLAIVRDGRVTKAQGYGFANLELRAHATKETVYEIGSNTKQFTAAAIMMLVQDGKHHLEDPITEYLPEAPQAWRNITIRHLLTHTSGIQNHVAVPHWLALEETGIGFLSQQAKMERLRRSIGGNSNRTDSGVLGVTDLASCRQSLIRRAAWV
jgi:CubicO group peptidase (beta-lactamase class C family)